MPISITFFTWKGTAKRKISLQGKLGSMRASALLGFHALTGSDIAGRFSGRTKDWCFKTFMFCDDKILDALAMLGNYNDLLPSDTGSQFKRFVCILYRSKIYTKLYELRWFLSSNRAAEEENLPLISGSLDLRIGRAHHISMIFRKASENHPCLPEPTAFGWKLDKDSNHFPLFTVEPTSSWSCPSPYEMWL